MASRDETTHRVEYRADEEVPLVFVRRLYTPGAPLPTPLLPVTESIVLGRASTGPVRLDADTRASRVHAELRVAPTTLETTVIDRSTNGTFVNGARVTSAVLADGDVVRVGSTFVMFRRKREATEPPLGDLTGDAPSMHALRRAVRLVAPTDATVLILGESGTGKELVARALGAAGARRGPFIALNCSAIPDALAESQLFGHVAGAFTGARGDQAGFFRAAHGGVLFLDEIGELSLPSQAKLLRVLETGEVIPVGGTRPIACDVRVVAATHRDLRREAARGRFRGDLFARIAELTVQTPPLRERREDILPLLCRVLGERAPPLSPDLVDALLNYGWPYNVRELLKVGKELAIKGAGLPQLTLDLVAERLRAPPASVEVRAAPAVPSGGPSPAAASHLPTEAPPRAPPPTERAVPGRGELDALLRKHRGNIADVAREVGRSRKQVYRWLEAHGLDAGAYRESKD